ncbi:MAG: acetolactate synthase small subunit [Actinomycetota bacterium]
MAITPKDALYDAPAPRGRKGTHTLSVLVENRPGVLARVAGLFARRGFNIESLAVGPTEDPKISRMTIVVKTESKPLEQVERQLDKLINVIHIQELTHGAVERELILIKVNADAGIRSQILEIVDIFRAKIVDVHPEALTLEATGTPEKLEALIDILRPYGIRELAQTGTVAIQRGKHTIDDAYLSVLREEAELEDVS